MGLRDTTLKPEQFYHVYNWGINHCEIFRTDENKWFFLSKLKIYLTPVCDIYAYCLMPDHFHLIIKVKPSDKIANFISKGNNIKNQNGLHSIDKIVSKQFAKLLSSYTQAFNKAEKRHGALLESPFRRSNIGSKVQLINLIVAIHKNPVGIKDNFEYFTYSSYRDIFSHYPGIVDSSLVIDVFGNMRNFVAAHQLPGKVILNIFDFVKV